MKKQKQNKRKLSLMSLYLLSSFSVAFIACSVIGLLLFYSSVSALNRMNLGQLAEKIDDLAKNISAQQETMRDISANLSAKILYRKSFLKANLYNDIRLLEDFCQYRTWTQICDSYFLFYSGETKIYSCSPIYDTGSTCTFDFYFARLAPAMDAKMLYEQLDAVTEFTVIQVAEGKESILLFAYPVYTMGRGNAEGKATLGFIVTDKLLRAHASTLIGELTGNVVLITRNGSEAIMHGELPDLSQTLMNESLDGQFVVAYEAPAIASRGLILQKTFNALYIVVAVLLVMAAAVVIGYTNYIPIKRLARKYIAAGKSRNRNEIETIETYFDSILSQKSSLEVDLLKQYEMIKRQILELLLRGDMGYVPLVKQSFMGIELPGPEYMVIALVTEHEPDEEETEKLAKQTQALSEPGMAFYFIRSTAKNNFAVLVNLPEDGNSADDSAGVALDYINSMFEEASGFHIGTSSAFDDISRLPRAFERALTKCGVPVGAQEDALFWFDEEMAGNVISAVACRAAGDALRFFQDFTKGAMKNGKSYAYEKMAYYRLLSRLSAYADTEGIHIDPAIIDQIVTASDRQEMNQGFGILLRGLSEEPDAISSGAREKSSVKAAKIIGYINENYADSGLCLNSLSARFGISNRYISSMIKAETGFSYKDYLTGIRIEQARRLLKTGATVTHTCEAVGYVDLANFIKVFKQTTGYTPSVYAKMKEDMDEK